MKGALMVCGTASHVGKTAVVAGLCRVLARQGVRVAPFKAQNMALNSGVTPAGHELARAQMAQAMAAGVEPEVAMGPILLKPTSERASQVMVMGRPWGVLDAAAYQMAKADLLPVVLDALAGLRERFDVVVAEGAGSPAEPNLADGDLVNLGLAVRAGLPAIVVGDIDRGGVFAALYGTVALLPRERRAMVRGLVVNKFRGDPGLLGDAPADLERRTGVHVLGVVPWVRDLSIDAEDSLSLPAAGTATATPGGALDVAAVRFPHISNFTDLDALAVEPGVSVRFVDRASALGRPDLVVLPGTKTTSADLAWMRATGLDRAVAVARDGGATVLGLCGGYQMLGRAIHEDGAAVEGLGCLPVTTTFQPDKVTRPRRGTALGQRVCGYQIHHGVVTRVNGDGWIALDDAWGAESEGAADPARHTWGTTLHGLLEEDGFRAAFLGLVSPGWQPSGVSFGAARQAQVDRLADVLEASLDLAAIEAIVKEGALPNP